MKAREEAIAEASRLVPKALRQKVNPKAKIAELLVDGVPIAKLEVPDFETELFEATGFEPGKLVDFGDVETLRRRRAASFPGTYANEFTAAETAAAFAATNPKAGGASFQVPFWPFPLPSAFGPPVFEPRRPNPKSIKPTVTTENGIRPITMRPLRFEILALTLCLEEPATILVRVDVRVIDRDDPNQTRDLVLHERVAVLDGMSYSQARELARKRAPDAAFDAIAKLMVHELKECFLVDGKNLRDPEPEHAPTPQLPAFTRDELVGGFK